MNSQRPVHEIRFGRIKVAIWVNQGANGPWHSVQVCRIYKDDQSVWKQSDSFNRDDLPLVCKALDQAHTWIYEQSQPARNGRESQGSAAEEAVAAIGAGATRPQ